MKHTIQLGFLCLLLSILLYGYGNASAQDSSEYFSNRDFETEYDESESVAITLNGDSASCDSDTVQISGSTVTITDEGTYILSGTLDDGMIIVDTEKTDKTQLVLNDVAIHSETSAAIYILQSDKVFITTASDTTNTLSNGGSFTAIDDNNIDAVIFSKEDVTLNGSGTLVITSPAGHGIVSKDSLRITSGNYDINCASHGLDGKDEVCLANGNFTIVSGKDGIHSDAYLMIEDGAFDLTSGGGSANASSQSSDTWGQFPNTGEMRGGKNGFWMNGEQEMASADANDDDDSTSMKGIKAETDLMIDGGTFSINSADDAVHSNTSVTINGGTFEITSGDDAFHADDTLTVTDGTIVVSECYEGLEGLHVIISGGDITLTAADDGLNAAGGVDTSGTAGRDAMEPYGMGSSASSDGSILISGGTLHITASGDGIDANGTVEITDGYIVVSGPIQGDTSTLDYDVSAAISGGTFIGTGAAGMAQTFSSSQQGVISVNTGGSASGKVTLSDSDGNVILSHTPDLSYAVVILSSPEIIAGETYTLTMGTISLTVTAS